MRPASLTVHFHNQKPVRAEFAPMKIAQIGPLAQCSATNLSGGTERTVSFAKAGEELYLHAAADSSPSPSTARNLLTRSPSLEIEILEACINAGAKLIARQHEVIRQLRSQNCPTDTSEGFLRVLEERQAARFEKWRVMALVNPHLARSGSEEKTA
jgi:hypothetical protein